MFIRNTVRAAVFAALWVLIAQGTVYAKQVVCVMSAHDDPAEVKRVRNVADFYGATTALLVVTESTADQQRINEAVANPDTFAVALTPGALRFVNKGQLFKATLRKSQQNVPLLVAGINEKSDPESLQRWSNGSVIGCHRAKTPGKASYKVGRIEGITGQLSGAELPVETSTINYLEVAGRNEPILSSETDGTLQPVFVRVQSGYQEIFFSSAETEMPAYPPSNPFRESWVFGNLAAEFVFLKYSGGQFVWHSPNHYANLTIDDAWLREPYGNVQYHKLLEEMQKHNFHTTIAFIPWNFDRSDPVIASLLRSNPDRFSICVHGNNHDHKEFDTYDKKSESAQIANVAQSLARMEKFHQLTNIPYDPVMVFPHSIAPEATLAGLKKYNFVATANSQNVPIGAEAPDDLEFDLRPATLHFANFPSLRRYSAEGSIPQSQLAIDAFLGNPMLFYVHQGFFASGINAFDETADRVNSLVPDTKWQSLGAIAEHLYLEKERSDGNYDIRAYSGDLRLENLSAKDRIAFVEKDEDFRIPFLVFVDGKPYAYERLGNHMLLRVSIPRKAAVHMTLRYAGGVDITKVDVSKSSFRVWMLRNLSDFRDDVISRTALGRAFIEEYTNNEGSWNRGAAALVVITLIAAITWRRRWGQKREQKSQVAHVVQSIH